jgi:uncharacterized Zn finger protein
MREFMSELIFSVKSGSTDEIYEVRASRNGSDLKITCTCRAGISGTYCKHRFSLLSGEVTDLLSGNHDDIEALKLLLSGTDVEQCINLVVKAEAELEIAKSKLSIEKKKLGKAMCF